MLGRRTDLDLRGDASRRYLPWIIAFMTFLAALSIAAAMMVTGAIHAWSEGLTGTMTVQVPPDFRDSDQDAVRMADALAVIRATPGVAEARALDESEARALLDPWLGDTDSAHEIPLPGLIDIRLRPRTSIDQSALRAELTAIDPAIVVDDHGRWLDDLVAIGDAVRLGAAAVVATVALAAILTVVYATRSGVAVHFATIEVLHLMGAPQGYISRQFEIRAFVIGLGGGVLGLMAAAVVLWLTGRVAPQTALSPLPEIALTAGQWALLCALPLATGLIAATTARATVFSALGKLN